MRRYGHTQMHQLLIARQHIPADDFIENQALHCPYYVPLEGRLGSDWGVIVNPDSKHFGRLMFEHDDCGCPDVEDSDYRHRGDPDQDGDMWWDGWRHLCDASCEPPCALGAESRARLDGGQDG